ncbi:MAG: alpha/beta fold hydrolase [Acidobacteria bacterium]|nr:alpha/beta fold hydrolase [Acidobacteriota bacterium]
MNTAQTTPRESQHSVWYTYRNFVLAMAVLGLLLTVFAFLRPMELVGSAVRLRLLISGMHSRYVTIGGEQIHYYVGGPAGAAPVLLVHGLGAKSADWAVLMPQLLSAGYRVYAIDLLGYGQSAKPRNASYSIAQEAGIVEEFIASQNLSSINLAGWSMGGWVAMRVALDKPAVVRRLVLYDSAGIVFYVPFGPEVFLPHTPEEVAKLENLLLPSRGPAMPSFVVRDFLRRQRQVGWVIKRSVDSMLAGHDILDGKLGALKMPVLIVWGKQDRLIPLSVGFDLHAQIPQSVLEIYDGCGHLAPAQCVDRVAPRTISFLKAEPPMAPQVVNVAR